MYPERKRRDNGRTVYNAFIRATDAATRFERAAETLAYWAGSVSGRGERWLVGDAAATLLHRALGNVETLVGLLNDDDAAEEIEKRAKSLAEMLRRRRLARKLSNVEGRTPEEREAFLAGAERMR